MPVRFDNPDIWIERRSAPGVPVSREEGHPYLPVFRVKDGPFDVVAQIWNGSFEAPAFHVMAKFYIANQRTNYEAELLGARDIPLVQVRGFPPTLVRMPLDEVPASNRISFGVELVHGDDANQLNNFGWLTVAPIYYLAAGQSADLTLAVRNPFHLPMAFRIEVETHGRFEDAIVGQPRAVPTWGSRTASSDLIFRHDRVDRLAKIAQWHEDRVMPLPKGWEIEMRATVMEAPAAAVIEISPKVRIPAECEPGRYPISICAYDLNDNLRGGISYLIDVGSPGAKSGRGN